MTVTASPSDHPEPIETASADELRSLQLERHVYESVPHYHAAFDAIAVHRTTARNWQTSLSSRSLPRRTCVRTIPSGCSRCPASRWSGACLLG
jgi:hypothetical protein